MDWTVSERAMVARHLKEAHGYRSLSVTEPLPQDTLVSLVTKSGCRCADEEFKAGEPEAEPEERARCQCKNTYCSCVPCSREATAEDLFCDECRDNAKHCHSEIGQGILMRKIQATLDRMQERKGALYWSKNEETGGYEIHREGGGRVCLRGWLALVRGRAGTRFLSRTSQTG